MSPLTCPWRLWPTTRAWGCVLIIAAAWLQGADCYAQDAPVDDPPAEEETAEAPERVDIEPTAEDEQIAERLERILAATEWFRAPAARVEEGVVFLGGQTGTSEHKEWATRLARNTQDVVAVVNRIEVDRPSLLDFSPAAAQLRDMTHTAVQAAPAAGVSLLLLVVSWFAASIVSRLVSRFSQRRVTNSLLRGVASKAAAVVVMLLGAYLALKVSGLTRLAATILGGTGLLGIIIGIAFRDIAENFLASVLISLQRPFQAGDLVTIDGRQGFVQAVTTRGTQLMTLDGNHVQIPNSMVYKSVIENASANPNQRLAFVVGIDYADSSSDAQQTVLDALRSHDAVLDDPEPLVLVDDLAASTVNLRVYFWVDGERHSILKVRSAVLRRVKRRLQQEGFTLPDESREMIFPQGVPVRMLEADAADSPAGASPPPSSQQAAPPAEEAEDESTAAEGGLESERKTIEEQAAGSRQLEEGKNLLEDGA
ncbi:Small-conductance mechanosensitive channel [Pseudobythopirellula maris]|uniref:Small-conductance mechanosensitive channel n=1 Tax=Pseudobythopirellula maris TaxID=2527991 RepID=A0A5C5ZN31_9BACT|nr:mechanosensitive ion channel domain-containing protein [Pseudobythopirellula maris]TWT88251.1 Small-conductance mechanosensitive channel [Pseudobythopirellula maris]